ncbi:MAG: carboxypeptidase regulatory-like domain-containing protein [Deltaproteobacteria bacterium]|nr:carboxypeptidase regulatory-like domain-containing protein [Deltaproteobacteria bacterium]
MLQLAPATVALLTGFLLLTTALPCARAAETETIAGSAGRRELPRARLDVGYGLSFRNDTQSVGLVDVSADGMTPSHLKADGAVWFGDLPVGLAATFGWERFALAGKDLLGQEVQLNAIGLSAGGGLAGRLDLAGWALEGDVGYLFGRLPIVDATSPGLKSGSVSSHGPMLAVRFGRPSGSWFLPDVHAAGIPYAFASTPSGSGNGWRLDAGVGLGLGGLPLGGLEWSAVLGYDYSLTKVDGDGGKFDQGAHRASLALRVTVPGAPKPIEDPAPPTGPGRIRGRLLDGDGRPVPLHPVQVVGANAVQTDESGAFLVGEAGPGLVSLRALAPGMKPVEQRVEVPPGTEVAVELRLVRPTGPGVIRGVVFDKPTDPARRHPVPGAVVEAAGFAPATADAGGAFVLEKVGPGLVPVKISAKGFVTGEEVVSVPAEAEARVELAIAAEAAKPLASLRGLVRTVSGKPLQAKLTVPEAKVSARTTSHGEFKIDVPGGKYKVRVEAAGFVTQVKSVEVADGDQAIFNIDMHPTK